MVISTIINTQSHYCSSKDIKDNLDLHLAQVTPQKVLIHYQIQGLFLKLQITSVQYDVGKLRGVSGGSLLS